MGFTEKLDSLMKERNINKSQLARESGIPYTTIDGFYKKGSENAKLSTLKKLCTYLNCSLDYLADDNVSEEHTTLAAHLEGDFTEDEMNEIMQFASFVKNKRK